MSDNENDTFNDEINKIDPLNNQYPIPSYELTIDSTAAFKEDESSDPEREDPKAKRILAINGKPASNSSDGPLGNAWAYSLDGKDICGPFEMYPEKSIVVEIDDRCWGSLVDPSDKLCVSVWIES